MSKGLFKHCGLALSTVCLGQVVSSEFMEHFYPKIHSTTPVFLNFHFALWTMGFVGAEVTALTLA